MPSTLAWRRAGLEHAYETVHYLSCLKFCFCLSTVSTIMIILQSGALGYNVTGVYRWILPTFELYNDKLLLLLVQLSNNWHTTL